MRLPTVELCCAAPHPDARKESETCNESLGQHPGWYALTGIVRHDPSPPDGRVYIRCPRRHCRMVNRFEIVPPEVSPPSHA